MSETPWLTVIGLGENGPDGLCPAALAALASAEVVIGPPRHLALLPDLQAEPIAWPVPFAQGIERLKSLRGRQVVALASGDPFWFGAGAVIARHFTPGEWRAIPGPSVFSLVAAYLGWPLEQTLCLGLHAQPMTRLRPYLAPGDRAIVLLRDGSAVATLADYLADMGFGASRLWVCEAMGGPRQQITEGLAEDIGGSFSHPVCVAIAMEGPAQAALPKTSGLADDLFESDGVMTKRPARALTLSALAPRAGEHLLDIGGGSGSISVEWALAHPRCRATTIEGRADRIGLIAANARAFGVENRIEIIEGQLPEALCDLDPPDVIFVGGGLSAELLQTLLAEFAPGTRLVINAVTLEAEMLLAAWQAEQGGELLRVELAQALPLGSRRGWKSAYPLVQWSGTL
ncbi:precorrin-6y C5,15-methyltransferase (decarboxylating) subunit CbiE [Roseovarius nubinhibens]|uniref:Cobalamin biosynthesis bifunctional protein CbiET n=1 Tax=Roseovarius nubinhibens TaxID=314263 RepID=A0A348WIW5_9RHOB|nr:cobalamin biosynthesis bifunctional protein CbiET [Roseovarius nubinhibens]